MRIFTSLRPRNPTDARSWAALCMAKIIMIISYTNGDALIIIIQMPDSYNMSRAHQKRSLNGIPGLPSTFNPQIVIPAPVETAVP